MTVAFGLPKVNMPLWPPMYSTTLENDATFSRMGRPAEKEPEPSVAGANIRRLREAVRLSQEDLAAAAGISRSAIARAELGGVMPDLSTLGALCGPLGVSLVEILTPYLAEGPIEPHVIAFLESPWRAALAPTEEEIHWLRSASTLMWSGTSPSPDTIAQFLMLRRTTQGGA